MSNIFEGLWARPPRPPYFPPGPPEEVCALFEQLTLELWQQGFPRYSARAILHRIRWHYHVERKMRHFKCNNNWTPIMARWMIALHPELENFFELRERSPHYLGMD